MTPAQQRPERPAHLRPSLIALVICGGTLGVAAREALSLSIRPIGSFPLAIFLINIVGAFALGVLLERLATAGGVESRSHAIRLFAGTGFLGGFTTYSALATDVDLLLRDGNVAVGILYAISTLLIGFGLAALGVVVGGRTRPGAAGRSR